MTKDYREPWKIGCRTQRSVFIDNAGGITIASAAQQLFDEANNAMTAERIVACVNACAGIDDLSTILHPAPAVDAGEVERLVDKLVDAVRLEVSRGSGIYTPHTARVKAARAALIEHVTGKGER